MSDIAKLLSALEEELWRANRAGDGTTYERLLRKDALLVSRFGTADKERIVPLIEANRNPFVRSELSDRQVRVLSPDSALVTYRVQYTARTDQGDVDHTALATTVYSREDDAWRVVLHQQTPL
ncbi:nuclear transport factor 2 family protein [Streptomyces spinosirectus]|jgi:uncharacterized protein (TIGR02246 family)|uniref:nuclear transport factor 2 family protein n=1 Tax=Streptomyces TaxID=1883 RepID=UPI000D3B599C|nr:MULTISPECIES: nuclear transport factor 2 family protein [Streptomyces]MBY8338874.1 nuclear transport factor 2 family protein [Streptomyces plumbidurans]PTN00364.1 uncharacterized protein (TIGR02246 family) [Streptomyces sp. VMFN-G11Ma]UIR20976.1 nuclear transport factor 2 family protein [Streptomyces spinosirectus]